MECHYLHICVLAAVIIGGSYAYGYGRDYVHGHGYRGHHEPHQRFYGGGYYAPPRDAYIHRAIYNQESRDHESSSDGDEHGDEHEEHHEDDDSKIWRFQISDDFDAYAYVDEHGHSAGFIIDLLSAVCERAHKKCFYMVDTNSHCWRTDGERELPGIGLMDGYYNACLGYWQSAPRRNSFNFSLPFTTDVTASLHYKAGDKIENPTQVTGKKIGFVGGWPISKRCFEHQSGFVGNSPGKYEAVLYGDHDLLVAAVNSGEVNAILTVDSYKEAPLGIQHAGPRFHCTEAGASVMTMYGSELLDWWNTAFMAMKHDGSFRRLCRSSARVHAAHGEIHCVH